MTDNQRVQTLCQQWEQTPKHTVDSHYVLVSGQRFQGPSRTNDCHLPEIMAVFQRHAGIQDNINLNIQLITSMVGLQALNVPDRLSEPHREVEHLHG